MARKNIRFFLIILITSVFLVGCSSKELPQGSDAVWDLVIIGDSSLWELGEAYATQIEKDVGVQVELADYANVAGSAGEVLGVLRTGGAMNLRLDKLPETLAEAEVVVIFLNPADSSRPANPLNMWGCFNYQPPASCSPSTYEKYTADMKAIWAEIFKLRKGKATILRATDIYNPLVSPWQEHGVFEACTECWANQSDAARLAAEAYNIPFLSRLDAFNGVNHDEDPRKKGYIREDGEHPTELMAQVTAELLAQMGYEPVTPP